MDTKIQNIRLEEEIKTSFINYAMSVIAARALPDVRDGLKPVHRRILYAMEELGLQPDKGYKKSARITGDTMGKYHPHGNAAIYDAMVRMAQDFSMRYPLVDGHGNFGSIDGDGAAAERYTEARLSRISSYMLEDIDKNTVDFVPNYDEEFIEPAVMPARFPNLLVNGVTGIAVGMATNIPPHNLKEVVNTVIRLIDNQTAGKETSIEELIAVLPGPDFPTGANILGISGIRQAYRSGKGSLTLRSTVNIEEMKNGRQRLVVTEIPFMVNKSVMVEKIGELIRDKKIEGVSDLRDESNRHGIRIVIELKKDANANVLLNKLYKFSQLQTTFSINMLALVNNEPKTLNISQILHYYIDHQIDVITRRTQFELDKAQKRLHILEGLLIALSNTDEVITLIRSSEDTAAAKLSLTERFDLTDIQATAIVDMRLRSLTGLEQEKLEDEHKELTALAEELLSILANHNKKLTMVKEELLSVRNKFADERRTKIHLEEGEEINIQDLIEDETCVITMTHLGYIKRMPLDAYKSQRRGGKGVIGVKTREEDIVKHLFVTNTHSFLFYFTNKGKVYANKVYDIPEANRTSKGRAIVNQINLGPGEKVTAVIPLREFKDDDYFIMVTKEGVIKRALTGRFQNFHKSGKVALTLKEGDELITVLEGKDSNEIFVATKLGMGIMFAAGDVRPSGHSAVGVKAITLGLGDEVIGAEIIREKKNMLMVSERGFGKCTELDAFRLQRRGGKGLKMKKLTSRTGYLVGISQVDPTDELMLINDLGVIIRIRIADIATKGRLTQGVKLITLEEDTKVISIAKIPMDVEDKD